MKIETRIVPEQVPRKFFFEHLKPYELLGRVVKGRRVLEVGCGDGYGSLYLARAGAGEVRGVDYEAPVIAMARQKYAHPNLTFQKMDATALDWPDDTFDIVCSFQVVEHIPEEKLSLYLGELKRVLKNGGQLYLSTLNLKHAAKTPESYRKNPAHCKEFTLQELRQLLSQVFSEIAVYGLHLTFKHHMYQRLKKLGIFRFLPEAINPVSGFYSTITAADFKITSAHLDNAIDFICVCKK